jgi:hypothetical protein
LHTQATPHSMRPMNSRRILAIATLCLSALASNPPATLGADAPAANPNDTFSRYEEELPEEEGWSKAVKGLQARLVIGKGHEFEGTWMPRVYVEFHSIQRPWATWSSTLCWVVILKQSSRPRLASHLHHQRANSEAVRSAAPGMSNFLTEALFVFPSTKGTTGSAEGRDSNWMCCMHSGQCRPATKRITFSRRRSPLPGALGPQAKVANGTAHSRFHR